MGHKALCPAGAVDKDPCLAAKLATGALLYRRPCGQGRLEELLAWDDVTPGDGVVQWHRRVPPKTYVGLPSTQGSTGATGKFCPTVRF